MKWIKRFFLWIADKLAAHWLSYLLGTAGVSAVFLAFWRWLIAKHKLELYGWGWVLLFFIVLATPIFLFWITTRKPKKERRLSDKTDIKNELNDWWVQRKTDFQRSLVYLVSPCPDGFPIHCSEVDNSKNLKKGSAARFLPEIIEDDSAYCIKSKGKETIIVQRKGLKIKAGPNGPY